MFKHNINFLLEEISNLPHIDKNEVMQEFIRERIDKSESTYAKELALMVDALISKNELKLMRKINKYGI